MDCISRRMMINDKRIKEYRRIQDMKVMETRKTVLRKEQRMLFARALAAGFKTFTSNQWLTRIQKRKRLSLRVFFGNVVPEICNALSRGILELRSESKIGRKEWDESAVVTFSAF